MSGDHIIAHPLPFAEWRYSADSGRHYKPHMHRAFCIGAVTQGQVVLRVEGSQVTLQPGSLALINPETLHCCNPPEGQKRSYYMLFLDAGWCLLLQRSLWRLDTFAPVTSALLEDPAIYRRYIRVMESLMDKGDLLEKEQALVELVERIFRAACGARPPKKDTPCRIEQVKRQLRANLATNLPLEFFARKLQANPFTLLRQFKAATGISPHAYRMNCRIEHAKTLLQQGHDLSQVALECGFFDQSHFHRHFKAITAVTPREYQINFIQ